MPTSRALYNAVDHALAKIYSNDHLTLDSGQRATGPQIAEFSNPKNSDFSVSVRDLNGLVTVSPGETKLIDLDLGDTGDALYLEVFPSPWLDEEQDGHDSLEGDV